MTAAFTDSNGPRLAAYIAEREKQVDQPLGLPGVELDFQGYHTRVPNGTHVHSTRTALDYAMALFAEGSPASVAKARAAMLKTLALQDQSTGSATFGIWPWFFEEPLSAMRPPDWNWADFCGIRIAHILCRYGEAMDADLRDKAARALRDAAWSIFRRNVGPHYTNISVKGGVVAIVAGEYLGDAFLLRYGRERLNGFVAHTRANGRFTEYNSPNYGVLVLVEVERGLLLVKDEASRAALRAIHAEFWQMAAISLHLPTGQICGPHSRSYSNLLGLNPSRVIGEGLGQPLFRCMPADGESEKEGALDTILIPRVPCPDELRKRILEAAAHPEKERRVRVNFTCMECAAVSASNAPERIARGGTFWSQGNACIGSVNCDNVWQQRRPVIGYLRVGDAVAVLRVRLRHARNDFACGFLQTVQEGPELLSACTLVTDRGDSHDHLDRPADGVFRLTELALAIELDAPGATIGAATGDGAYTMQAGDHCVDIHPVMAEFGGYPVDWCAVQTPTGVALRALINGGETVELTPSAMCDVCIGFHLRVRHADCGADEISTRIEKREDFIALSVDSSRAHFDLSVPRTPRPLPLP
jgi:hypothetical protein